MKRFLLLLTLIGPASALSAAPASAAAPSIPMRDVLQICQEAEKAPPAKAVCLAYLDAVVATVNQISVLIGAESGSRPPFLFCVPPSTDDQALIGTFIAFARRNAQHGGVAAGAIVMAAFADRWPCARK